MSTKKSQLTLEQRVLKYIGEKGLINSGQKIVIAVSGGPDSVCLLHILYQIQGDLDISLHIAHLNHQLRGQESEADARYVENLAHRLDIPATIEKKDVSRFQTEHRLSLEEAAREVRYSFLARVAREIGATRVAVGHTENDQAETILLHIIRGTGTQGLRGLEPIHTLQFSGNQLTVVRPLLEIKRQETEIYCARHKLVPHLDTSNLSLNLLRNRVRHELLPLLQEYNPGILDSLLRIGRIAEDDLAFLDAEVEKAWKEVVLKRKNRSQSPFNKGKRMSEDFLIFDKKKFKNLAPALQRHLLRRAIDELLGTLKDIETRHIEEVLDALEKPAGRRITLPEGLIFSIEYNCYLLGFHPEALSPFPELKGTYEVKAPGVTEIPGWRIEAEVSITNNQIPITRQISNLKSQITKTKTSLLPDPSSLRSSSMTDVRNERINGEFIECFDFGKTGGKINLRTWEAGDWFQPLGQNQPEKVGRFMIDAKVPQTWRRNIPIFYTSEQIIWVAGWRIDDRVKVTDKTRAILCLRMVRKNKEVSTRHFTQ